MEEEYFDKDCRSKRFVTSNFKKRENKRELDERNNKIDRRMQQSLRDKYGEDYLSKLDNGDIYTNGGTCQIKEERKDESDFDWSADEKKNGPKSKKANKNSKKNKAEKTKEYEEDLLHCAPKQKGLKKY